MLFVNGVDNMDYLVSQVNINNFGKRKLWKLFMVMCPQKDTQETVICLVSKSGDCDGLKNR